MDLAFPGVAAWPQAGVEGQVAAQDQRAAAVLRQPRMHQRERQRIRMQAQSLARPVGLGAQRATVVRNQAGTAQRPVGAALGEPGRLLQLPCAALGRSDAQGIQSALPVFAAPLRAARQGDRAHRIAGIGVHPQVLHRAACIQAQLIQHHADVHRVRAHRQFAVAAAPGQASAQADGIGAPVVPAQLATGQIGLDIRRRARAGQLDRALQGAAAGGQQIGQVQRRQRSIHREPIADLALGLHAAAAERHRQLTLAVLAVQRELATRIQRPPTQPARQFGQIQGGVEAAGLARLALAAEFTGQVAVPVGQEIAGIEAGQLRFHVPLQDRRPRHFAIGIQLAGRHLRAQRLHRGALAVAGRIEFDLRLLTGAGEAGLADRRPVLQLAGHAQIGVGADGGLGAVAPAQATRVDREPELRIGRILEVGAPAQGGDAFERAHDQRFHRQYLVGDGHLRGIDHQRGLILDHAALQCCLAARAIGLQIEGERQAVLGDGQRRQIQQIGLAGEMPGRILGALQGEQHPHRRGCVAGERHLHLVDVAARDQAQSSRGLAGRCGEHAGRDQVGAVALARCIAAVRVEAAAVGVERELLGGEVAVADIDAATPATDVDRRFAGLGNPEPVDDQGVGLDRQRHLDLRQRFGPAWQFERFVAFRHVQGRIADLQRVQPQALAQQRTQIRIQVHALGGEMDLVPAEVDTVQGQRSGQRTFDLLPGQRGVGRQPRHHLRQQHIAAGHGLQQPVQAEAQQQDQHAGADRAADGEHAHARPASRPQFGDAGFALFRGDVVGGPAHRSVPMLR